MSTDSRRGGIVQFTPFDAAAFLDTPDAVREYVRQTLEEDGLEGLKRALGVIARSRGMQQLARQSGLSRQNLYRALSEDADPRLSTLQRVMEALQIRLTVAG